jgi:nitrite reductase/ring-hydroxylating ferredoxin subunit
VRRGRQVFCLYSECPFEKGSSLDDALCLGNKLCCLDHGCTFNLETGHIESGPSMLDLAIFPTLVT